MSQRALGAQFHVTTVENAEKLQREGFKLGQPGGFGQVVNNHGRGVYTAPKHDADTWASLMVQENEQASLKILPVEVDPSARVHTYDAFPDWHPGRAPISVSRHLERHPDVAAHYVPPPPPHWSDRPMPSDEIHALGEAVVRAGYHALEIKPPHGAEQTVWFDPSKVRPSS